MKDKIMLYAIIAIAFVAAIMFAIYPIAFYILIGVAGFLGIVYLCSKYKWARIATFIAAFVGLIGGSAYSYVKLNEYYTAVGGVFGRISDFFGTNIVEVEDLTFNFSNIQLKDSGDQQQYVAQITKDAKFNIDTNKNYSVYVNDIPCTYVEVTKSYVLADYTFTFQDDDLSEIMTDTLKFRFAFNQNSTQFNISTSGGTKAQRLWNYYFNKNGFVVKLAESKFDHDGNMQQTNGTVDYALANYYVQGTKWMTQCYHINDQVNFPFPDQISTKFQGWSVDYENKIEEPYYITKHTDFYAIEGEATMFTIVYKHRDQVLFTERYVEGTEMTEPQAPTIIGYEFNYWEDENGERFDFVGKTATKDMILTANATGLGQRIKFRFALADDTTKQDKGAGRLICGQYDGTNGVYPGRSNDYSGLLECVATSGKNFTTSAYLVSGYEPKLDSSGKIQVKIIDNDEENSTNKVIIGESEIPNFKNTGFVYFVSFKISDVNTPMTVLILVEPMHYNIEFIDREGNRADKEEPIVTVKDLVYGQPVDLKTALSEAYYKKLTSHKNPDISSKMHLEGWFTYELCGGTQCFTADYLCLLDDGWHVYPYTYSGSSWSRAQYYNETTHTFSVFAGYKVNS